MVESEGAAIEPLINSLIVVKKVDGSFKAYCVIMEKKPGENYINTIDWSPLRKGNGK